MSSWRSGTEVLNRTVRWRGGGGRGGNIVVADGLRRSGEPGEDVGCWRGVSMPGREGGIGEVARLLLIVEIGLGGGEVDGGRLGKTMCL